MPVPSLPLELSHYILKLSASLFNLPSGFLERIEHLKSCALVCRDWRWFSQQLLLEHLSPQGPPDKFFGTLKALDVNFVTHVASLAITNGSSPRPRWMEEYAALSQDVLGMVQRMVHLREISVTDFEVNWLLLLKHLDPASLQVMRLCNCHILATDSLCQNDIPDFTALRFLAFESIGGRTPSTMFLSLFPNLVGLSFQDFMWTTKPPSMNPPALPIVPVTPLSLELDDQDVPTTNLLRDILSTGKVKHLRADADVLEQILDGYSGPTFESVSCLTMLSFAISIEFVPYSRDEEIEEEWDHYHHSFRRSFKNILSFFPSLAELRLTPSRGQAKLLYDWNKNTANGYMMSECLAHGVSFIVKVREDSLDEFWNPISDFPFHTFAGLFNPYFRLDGNRGVDDT